MRLNIQSYKAEETRDRHKHRSNRRRDGEEKTNATGSGRSIQEKRKRSGRDLL